MNVTALDTDKKMGTKLAAWVWTLLDSMGMLTAVIAFINLDTVEKIIVFVASMLFFGYRIYNLHLDSARKKIENEEKMFELQQKKIKSQSK